MTGGFFGALGGKDLVVEAGEEPLCAGPANHWRGIEAVGGKLFLTSRRLVFRPHRVNVQAEERAWPIDDVVDAQPTNTLWIVPNGLLVLLRDGRREKFVVEDRASWLARLAEARTRTRSEER